MLKRSDYDTIKEYARELGLRAIPAALEEQMTSSAYADLPFEKRLILLLETETVAKQNRRVEYLRSQARLAEKSASIEHITYAPQRGLTKSHILELSGEIIYSKQPISSSLAQPEPARVMSHRRWPTKR